MAMTARFDADFSKFIGELSKVDHKLKDFDISTDKSSARLMRLADSMQGDKIVRGAAEAVAAIGKLEGGVKSLTDGELRRFGSQIDEATQKIERMGKSVPPAMAEAKAAIDAAREASAKLSKTAEDSSGGFSAMKTAAVGAIAGIASSLTTMGVSALKDFALGALDAGGKITDLAAKTGLTTKEVQTFSYAASMSGASMETVSGAVSKLSNNLVEGNDSTLYALKSVGLELGALQAMAPGQAFEAVATAIAKVPDPMQQTKLAMDLLGKSGVEVLPAIKGGFSDAAAEAERLGMVIDDESIAALDDMGDAYDRLELRAQVAVANLAKHFEPYIAQIERLLRAKPEQMGDIVAGMLNRTGQSMWYSAQGAYNAAPWDQKLGTAVRQGPKQFLGRALVGASGLFGNAANYDPNFDPNNPLGPMPGLEAMPIPAAPPKAPPLLKPPTAADNKAAAALAKYNDEIAELTGATTIAGAERLAKQIREIGGASLTLEAGAKSAKSLMTALAVGREQAERGVPGAAASVGRLEAALNQIPIASKRVPVNMLTVQGSINAAASTARVLSDNVRGVNSAMTGLIQSTNPLEGKLVGLAPALEPTRVKVTQIGKATTDWAGSIKTVAGSFAVLAQNMGDSNGKVAQLTGGIFAAADAGASFADAMGKLTAAGDKFGKSKGAAGLAGAMAGISAGFAFGGMVQGKGKGALAGAAGGAASGALAGTMIAPGIGTAIGAGVGAIAGAIGGWFAGGAKEKEAIKGIAEHKAALLGAFESREDLIKQAKRVGISEADLTTNILNNTKHVSNYEAATKRLADAFAKEQKAADALAKDLGKVAEVNGVLSKQQATGLRGALAKGGGPETEAAKAFLDQQRGSLIAGLQGALDSGAALGPGMVAAIGESLPAAFAELRRSGMSSIDAIKELAPLLESFQKNAVDAGAGSTPGFDLLNSQLGIIKDEKLGPMIEQAGYASQAMAALANTGWLNQASFQGFSGSITGTFDALIAGGKDSETAMMLLQGPLQNLWQLQKDFGYEVTESQAALLASAEAAGKIGEAFRPTEDRMLTSLDAVVERLDKLIEVFSDDMPAGAATGAEESKNVIAAAFKGFSLTVPIVYSYPEGGPSALPSGSLPPTAPATPADAGGGTSAARAATAGSSGAGDVYLDGDRVGYHVARRLQDVSDFVGA